MVTITQNTDLATTWLINSSDDNWVLDKDAEINSNISPAIFVDIGFTGNKVVVRGDISVTNPVKAIEVLGDDTLLIISESSLVDSALSNVGVYATGASFALFNYSQISGILSGIYVSDGASVDNFGTIRGGDAIFSPGGQIVLFNFKNIIGQDSGIAISADGSWIYNVKQGIIRGGDYGIELTGNGSGEITNKGLIKGNIAISDMGANLTVENAGIINGLVDLGAGQDIFDTRKGTLKGQVDGGADADTYMISNANINIAEQANNGMDLVQSTVSYTLGANLENLALLGKANVNGTGNAGNNGITGNKGDNVLKGLSGQDSFYSSKGNDLMIGGVDADVFAFDLGTQNDVIEDFTDGVDLINSSFVRNQLDFDFMFANYLTVKGDDLLISYGPDTLLIKNLEKANLTFVDFLII